MRSSSGPSPGLTSVGRSRYGPSRSRDRSSWMAGSGQPFTRAEGSMSKLKAGETAVRVTEQAVQVCGGYGYVKDLPVEKWYRDSKIYTLFEGTSEIQRLVISRALASE